MAAPVSIQDIESVDDYWGPTFRAILEGNATEQISDQIEARIRQHDKEIEKICNLYYQVNRVLAHRPCALWSCNKHYKTGHLFIYKNSEHYKTLPPTFQLIIHFPKCGRLHL